MPAKLNALLFLGSTRDGRMADRVAKHMLRHMQPKYNVKVIDPRELQLPVLKQPLHFYKDQSQVPEVLQKLNKDVQEADMFVLLTAEYNNSVSPALSNTLDYIPPASYAYKPSGIVCYSMGPYAGIRAASHLRCILSELGTMSVPNLFTIPTVQNSLEEDGTPQSERMDTGAARLLTQLEWYAQAMKAHRAASGTP